MLRGIKTSKIKKDVFKYLLEQIVYYFYAKLNL